MFPIVPDVQELKTLSSDALRTLRTEIKAKSKEIKGRALSADEAAEAIAAAEGVARIDEVLAERKAEQEAFQAAADRLAALADEDDDEGGDGEGGDDEGGDGGDDEAGDDDGDEAKTDEGEQLADKPAAAHLEPVRARPRSFGRSGSQPAPAPTPTPAAPDELSLSEMVSTGAGALKSGERYGSWQDVVDDLLMVGENITAGSPRRPVASIFANIPEANRLGDDPIENALKLGRMRSFAQDAGGDELTAAFCAPPTPSYEIGCRLTDRRPVFNSMATYAAPRGTVTIYPSPTLDDITTGYGIWDKDDDADPEAVKEACQTISCADSEQFWMYGIYRCLTVKNILQMTFPELVEAYLNRLAAAQARMAERQLLNTMGARATSVQAPPWDYDGAVNIVTGLLHVLTLHQDSTRWDTLGDEMQGWAPRWIRQAMRITLARRRNTNGSGVTLPSEDYIDGLFRDVGIDMTWFIDTPTWAPTIPPVQAAGDLRKLPETSPFLIAPRGKLRLIDRGNLNIGVAPGNLYRDNESNSHNEFTFFFESFEGLVDTDTCPMYLLDIPTCWNGVQVADITAPECDGTTSGS